MITIIAKYNQDMKLKKLLDNANYLSITVDLWTDRRMRAFSGVTDYFLDFDCVLHALLLDFLQFKSPHTEENICNTTRKNLDNLKIKDKVQWIIADNASNMIKAFKFYLNVNDDTYDTQHDNSEKRLPCFAHCLQLVIQDRVEDVSYNLSSK
ncbi:unnamed protein product [Adineta steineri]|uniref:Transposase n=1 Tax=Adineta steineri TaxID=433720 RepID=A0A813P2U2_9BILA|nr:unnamed protein product [Adineta steineri]